MKTIRDALVIPGLVLAMALWCAGCPALFGSNGGTPTDNVADNVTDNTASGTDNEASGGNDNSDATDGGDGGDQVAGAVADHLALTHSTCFRWSSSRPRALPCISSTVTRRMAASLSPAWT